MTLEIAKRYDEANATGMVKALDVRVVLPSDQLVAVACATRDARVQSILDVALLQERNASPQSESREHKVFPIGCSTLLDARSNVSSTDASGWRLRLVRTGCELVPTALVQDVLRHRDILELCWRTCTDDAIDTLSASDPDKQRIVSDSYEGGSNVYLAEATVASSDVEQSATNTVATALPLRGAMQLLEHLAALEAQIATLLLSVRDADAYSRSSRSSSTTATTTNNSSSTSGRIKMSELLPPLLRVARALQPHSQSMPYTSVYTRRFPIEDYTRDLDRAFADASVAASALPRVAVVHQGYVVCGAWSAFWRHQRREFACLSDDSVLRFFATERQCSEFLFALARSRSSMIGEAVAMLDAHAPQSQIDLSDTARNWSVRRGATDASARHAFALVEHRTTLRLIVDVATDADAAAWVAAIDAELRLFEQLAAVQCAWRVAMQQDAECAAVCDATRTQTQQPASTVALRTQGSNSSEDCRDRPAMATAFTSDVPSHSERSRQRLALPLRWLHAHIERLHGRAARYQRLQCANLSQALKDLRRDRIRINGHVLLGAHVDDVLVALTTAILRALSSGSAHVDRPHTSCSTSTDAQSLRLEMVALRLARELLVSSSRTDGGGDILDALHLVFPAADYRLCPLANDSMPICVELSSESTAAVASAQVEPATPVVEITIRMGYCVLRSVSEVPTADDLVHLADTSVVASGEVVDSQQRTRATATAATPSVEVVGTYYKKLVGDFATWHQVDGHVTIALRP